MSKVPYKASKAWHLGHTLAIDVYQLAVNLYQLGQTDLAKAIHESSRSVPHHIADAHRDKTEAQKQEHFQAARDALSELDAHLLFLQELQHIDEQTRSALSARAEEVHRILGSMMLTPQPATATLPAPIELETQEEENGTIDNRTQERDALRMGGDAVPRSRLQPESDGAWRINRQRANQKFDRRQGTRKNIQG